MPPTGNSHENIVMVNTVSLAFFGATKKLKEKHETGFGIMTLKIERVCVLSSGKHSRQDVAWTSFL